MKEIQITKINQEDETLTISYDYTEGYEKKNHLGQVMEVTGEAGGGQITIKCKTTYQAIQLQDLLLDDVVSILEGYF